MKKTLYIRLAANGIKNNRRLYTPYIAAFSGMTAMLYIISFLSYSETVSSMTGGRTLSSILNFGSLVMIIFSAIFLFYTNSFLVRRRKREFGLYNILGMGKKSINRIMLWETLIIYLVSQTLGLTVGISLSKAVELALIHIVRVEVNYSIFISVPSLILTLVSFGIIILLIYLNSLRQLHASSPLQLMRSESYGEKPLKANPLFAIVGAALMGGAYYIATIIDNPITAMATFFLAVVMVIIATYLLFTAGSVTFCRLLKKNKKYYYQPSHFVSVSSMAFRMKRNGAGLASICILATMVLVTASSTVSLYFGLEDQVNKECPRDISVTLRLHETTGFGDERIAEIRQAFDKCLKEHDINTDGMLKTEIITFNGLMTADSLYIDYNKPLQNSKYMQICIIPLEAYNAAAKAKALLSEGEALVYAKNGYTNGTVALKYGDNNVSLKITGSAEKGVLDIIEQFQTPEERIYLVTRSDEEAVKTALAFYAEDYETPYQLGRNMLMYAFDSYTGDEEEIEIYNMLKKAIINSNAYSTENAVRNYSIRSAANDRSDYYAIYGGLLFLGIVFSLAFCVTAALIMYYKQLSEGYEDKARFGIMQKVGMSKRAIRKSVNSQMLTVFALPLAAAGIHMVFAFHMVKLMLQALGLINTQLFLYTVLGSFALFALFYIVTYEITANSYYSIVSKIEND